MEGYERVVVIEVAKSVGVLWSVQGFIQGVNCRNPTVASSWLPCLVVQSFVTVNILWF